MRMRHSNVAGKINSDSFWDYFSIGTSNLQYWAYHSKISLEPSFRTAIGHSLDMDRFVQMSPGRQILKCLHTFSSNTIQCCVSIDRKIVDDLSHFAYPISASSAVGFSISLMVSFTCVPDLDVCLLTDTSYQGFELLIAFVLCWCINEKNTKYLS